MYKGKIIIISGPSGSGKTTLHKKLLLSRRFQEKLVKSISATTRPKRPNELHGRDYLFFTKKDFFRAKRVGHFLEWQKVFDNYYGTPRHNVEKLLKQGKNVLLCIDVKGAKVIARHFPEAVRIFIKAPSLAVLKKRLQLRGSETKKDLMKRLAIAKSEMREAKKYDYIVENQNLSNATKRLKDIVSKELTKGK